MTPGQAVRKLTGRHFTTLGDAYRRIFVDLDRIIPVLSRGIPAGARVLDIGGGDGAVVERLLRARPDLSVTMCDLAPAIGAFVSDAHRARVTLRPATDFTRIDGRFDVVTLTDVVHHVPLAARDGFFAALAAARARWGAGAILIKDVEPQGARARLALLSDWYITGDRHVVPFARRDLAAIAARHFPDARRESVVPDWPNYCEVLRWPDERPA